MSIAAIGDSSGRRILICGGGSGIGEACAFGLAESGGRVAVADLDLDAARNVTSRVRAAGGNANAVFVDVTNAVSCADAVAATMAMWHGIDVLVNCAGVLVTGPVVDTTIADWDRVMCVNLRGTFLMCRAVIPLMTECGGGVIVNLASGAGVSPIADLAAYGASKAAIVMLTKSIALDYGSAGIRANAVCPGVVDTPMMKGRGRGDHDRAMAAEAKRHVLGRVSQAREVADLIGYLASDACSFMTGSAVVFDGGFTLSSARSI